MGWSQVVYTLHTRSSLIWLVILILIGGLTSFPICSILSNMGPNLLFKTNVGVGKQGHGASHVGFLYQRQVNQELMQHCIVFIW